MEESGRGDGSENDKSVEEHCGSHEKKVERNKEDWLSKREWLARNAGKRFLPEREKIRMGWNGSRGEDELGKKCREGVCARCAK
jgi:hypothetical protein